jgi:YD repeat-containing protein
MSDHEQSLDSSKNSLNQSPPANEAANTAKAPTMRPNSNDTFNSSSNPLYPRMMPAPAVNHDPGLSVAESLKILAARAVDVSRLYRPSDHASGIHANLASNTVSGPASIAELARALQNDPDLIFEWVYNNIEYTPTFGEQKGALGCLIDGIGNDFDQSALLAALLTQAGYSPSLVFGNIEFSAAEAGAWLGTDPADLSQSVNMLFNGGVPVQYANNLPYTTAYFPHVWVQVALNGTTYFFDPSYKTYTSVAGINLATATGYTQAGMLAQARVGATIDPNGIFVQNENRTNLRAQLATYANSLVSYIRSNSPAATLDDVIGGRKIVPLAGPVRLTHLPYQDPLDVPVIWSSVPDGYRVTVDVVCADINVRFFGSDVHQQRLCIFFNGLGQPVLTLNGAVVSTGTFVPTDFSYQIGHPYLNINVNQNLTEQVFATRSFLIGISLGPTGKGIIDFYQKQYAQNLMAGGSTDSEPILGAQLASSFFSYVAQVTAAFDVGARIGDCGFLAHHTAGVAVWDTAGAPADQARGLFDVGGIAAFVSSLHATANTTAVASALGQNAHVLEMAGLQQTYGVVSVGPAKIVDYGNQIGLQTLKITPANQGTTLPLLSGYDAFALSVINNGLAGGNSCYLPQTAPEMIGSASCRGLIEISSFGAIFGWLGTSKGGGTTEYAQKPKPETPDKNPDDPVTGDPVVERTGDFRFEQSDMTVGSAGFPFTLDFRSMYDSRTFNSVGVIGRGWTHNWLMKATLSSDGMKGLGADSPVEAAASIVEMLVLEDLYADLTYPVEKILLGAMCAQWWSDSLSNNIVNVSLPEGNRVFTLLQDGTYNPPLNNASTLTLAGGLYQLTTPDQQKLNFDVNGNLSTWVFPFGVTITLGYVGGVLTTISNGLSRQLTLAYTGSFLSSVTDGNARSVTYAVNAITNQLDSITDPLSHATTFSYDGSGRLLSYFLPQNPVNAMVINTYDSLNRISSQLDASGHLRTYYLTGSRSQIVDPVGNSTITYFDEHGEIVQQVDELGNVTKFVMDGLKRLTQRILPEGNSVQYTYDNAHGLASRMNILTETRIAKAGSGLGNIVSTWTYDATYNKKHTLLDPRSNTWTWNYDALTGNLLSFVKPIVGGQTPQEVWTYNGRGQVLTYTDETSVVTKNTYDVATEKLLSTVHDFGVNPHLNLTTNFDYDAVGNLTNVTDPNNNLTVRIFDNKRRITQKTAPAPFNYLIKYGYDFNDNLTSIQRQVTSTPTFQTYTLTYTLFNKANTLTDPAFNVTTKNYDLLDRLWKVTDAENRVTTFSYDARSNLFTIVDAMGIVSETRLYTNNGLLASIQDANGNLTQYTRDGFDRLDKTIYADSSFEENQVFDANGNVLTELVNDFWTDCRLNLV